MLYVMLNGSKLWRYRYRYNEVAKMLSLGSYPEVSLKAARLARDNARSLLNAGIDPSQNRNEVKMVRAQAIENHFKAVAMAWWEHWRIGGHSVSIHAPAWVATFPSLCYSLEIKCFNPRSRVGSDPSNMFVPA